MSRRPHQVWRHVHFIGIGGVGMSGLATILLDFGVPVSGSDPVESAASRRLAARGTGIRSTHAADNLPQATDTVVFSSAIASDNAELSAARERGLRCLRRGEFLAELATFFTTVVAVSGSHGKTTTTAMLAHILHENGGKPGFLIGGEVPGWSAPATAGGGRLLVTEVDESDGTQALLASDIGVILNIDDDHCWSLGGVDSLERCFADFARRAGEVLAWHSATVERVLKGAESAVYLTARDVPDELVLPIAGRHNRINATVAIEVATRLGVERHRAQAALTSFPGVDRRMSVRYRSPDGRRVIVEDYAHHPAELAVALDCLREAYPRHCLQVIFQPHRFERIKRFAADFRQLLSTADRVVVYDTFAAWLDDCEVADARTIVAGLAGARFWRGEAELLAAELADSANGEAVVFAVIGAGDVTRLVAPLRSRLVDEELENFALALAASGTDCDLRRDMPWSRLTTLGIGRACPLLVGPRDENALRGVLELAAARGLPVRVLGRGSNLVGCDDARLEVVVRLAAGVFVESTLVADDVVLAGGGCPLKNLLLAAGGEGRLRPELAALAWIPGTIGGAVVMNAGAGGVEIGDEVLAIHAMAGDGSRFSLAGEKVDWQYRTSGWPADAIITQVRLRLGTGDAEAFHEAYRQAGARRRQRQPAGRSTGCVFRNAGDSPAGRLIEKSALKGKRVGGCQVAGRHANFIIAEKAAGERDFVRLAMAVKRQVFEQTGVVLSCETLCVNPESKLDIEQAVVPPVVTVLKGGPSAERKISLISGAAVAYGLREAGLTVHELDCREAVLPAIPADTDVVFPVLHGTFGEDGQLQALLDAAGWRYVGSGSEASRLAMVKSETKRILQSIEVPTARYRRVVSVDESPPADLTFPLIVKPDAQGSSVGMSKLDTACVRAWRRALAVGLAVDTAVLAEEFVTGVEITVGILHGEALPICEIVPPDGRFFDYDAKYDHLHGHTRYLCPAERISPKTRKLAAEYALRFYLALGAKDMLRVDFIVDAAGLPWCLEANTIPGFTPTSLLPKAAAVHGIAFPELCARLATARPPPRA